MLRTEHQYSPIVSVACSCFWGCGVVTWWLFLELMSGVDELIVSDEYDRVI